MITGSGKLKSRSEGKKKQFRLIVEKINKIKGRDVDSLFQKLHVRFSRETNCTSCANCCKVLGPRLTYIDVKRLASSLKTGTSGIFEKYVSTDEDGDYVFKSMPCPFLQEDNHCRVYDARPRACRDYPHTDQKNIGAIMSICLQNTAICPVVFRIFEALGNELK